MNPRLSLPLLALSALLFSSCTLAAPGVLLVAGVRDPGRFARSTVGTAGTPGSPAQGLFDEVNQLLSEEYGGLSMVDRAGLTRDYQAKLDAACQAAQLTCSREVAYPVVEAEVEALADPHSFFERPNQYQDFVASATGASRLQFGIRLGQLDGESRVVMGVISGSAAAEADLRRGDVLRTIDGLPYTYEGLQKARQAGTPVSLGVQRAGAGATLTLTITSRDSTTRDLPTLTQVGTVGVIRVPTFLAGGGVADRVHELVAQAQSERLSGLVVDLRGDPGGSLFECDGAASAFVPSFSRLSRSPEGDARTQVSMGTRLEDGRASSVDVPALWTGPLSVVVDKGSASCSEFFAYEVQYAKRGVIVGEATAGVGNTATQVFALRDPAGGGAKPAGLQLTVLSYVKPDGTPYPTQVKPDVPGQDDILKLTQGEDVLLNAAIAALKDAPGVAQGALPAQPVSDGGAGR